MLLRGRVFCPAQQLALDDGVVAIDGDVIAFVGTFSEFRQLPGEFQRTWSGDLPIRCGVITPGLVDAHTHAAWIGSRHGEYTAKLQGANYESIAKLGGGIVSSMLALESASVDLIADTLTKRLAHMASMGVTSVEVKSGYGLRPELEIRQLEAISRVAKNPMLPRVISTFLALHALPPEARRDGATRSAYIQDVVRLTRDVAERGLAQFVDVYVDRNAFSPTEARPVLEAARTCGLGLRLHVGQFADVGGAELAGSLGARSVDHLEHVGATGLAALRAAGVYATMLPVASFVLNQKPPDIAAIRQAGVPMLVASDANPGTAPTESLPLAMCFAARLYGLTSAEIWSGVTHLAADSLHIPTGTLRVGSQADIAAFDLPHEDALLQPWGTGKATLVLRSGVTISG